MAAGHQEPLEAFSALRSAATGVDNDLGKGMVRLLASVFSGPNAGAWPRRRDQVAVDGHGALEDQGCEEALSHRPHRLACPLQ